MRQFRVGTFSMGILLISTGIILMLGRFTSIDPVKLILDFWPVILILLGLEILVYVYSAKEASPKIKYDGLSILMAMFIIILSIGAYVGTMVIERYPYLLK